MKKHRVMIITREIGQRHQTRDDVRLVIIDEKEWESEYVL